MKKANYRKSKLFDSLSFKEFPKDEIQEARTTFKASTPTNPTPSSTPPIPSSNAHPTSNSDGGFHDRKNRFRLILFDLLRGFNFNDADMLAVSSMAISKIGPPKNDEKLIVHGIFLDSDTEETLRRAAKNINSLLEDQKRLTQKVSATIKAQSCLRMWLERKRYLALPKNHKSLLLSYHEAVNEVIDSEKTFIKTLESAQEEYKTGLLNKGLVDATDITILFNGLEECLGLHQKFVQDINSTTDREWPFFKSLGYKLLKIAPSFFTLYSNYARSFNQSKEKLSSLSSNSKVLSVLQECSKTVKHSFESILQLPINHIAKLPNLIEKLSSTILYQDRTYHNSVEAFSVFNNTATAVSDILKEAEEQQLIKLYNQFFDESEQPYDLKKKGRTLIRSGEAIVEKKNRLLYLFSDVLVVTQPQQLSSGEKQSAVVVRTVFPLQNATLNDISESSRATGRTKNGRFDLRSNDLSLIFTVPLEDRSTWLKSLTDVIEFWNRNKLFGLDLTEVLVRENREAVGIPVIVETLMQFIVEQGTKEEGLLRISGNLTEVNALKEQFNKGESPDLLLYALPSVCSCFKLYLRELPNPIIPFGLFDSLTTLQETCEDLQEKLRELKLAFSQIPKTHYLLLQKIIRFLVIISNESSINKMTPQNLSIVIAPCLFRPLAPTIESSMKAPLINSLVEFIIECYEEIFQDYDNTPRKGPSGLINGQFKMKTNRSSPVPADPVPTQPLPTQPVPTPKEETNPVNQNEGWKRITTEPNKKKATPLRLMNRFSRQIVKPTHGGFDEELDEDLLEFDSNSPQAELLRSAAVLQLPTSKFLCCEDSSEDHDDLPSLSPPSISPAIAASTPSPAAEERPVTTWGIPSTPATRSSGSAIGIRTPPASDLSPIQIPTPDPPSIPSGSVTSRDTPLMFRKPTLKMERHSSGKSLLGMQKVLANQNNSAK